MRFKLFGRLRGDASEEDDSGSGEEGDNNMEFGGNTLQRTVENMFSQGYSQEEIREELRGQYSPDRIERAVNDAVATSATGSGSPDSPQPMTPYQKNDDAVSPVDEGFQNSQADEEGNSFQDSPQQDFQEPQGNAGGNTARPPQGEAPDQGVEELVETIVAENFEMVESEFENVYTEIDSMKEDVEDLKERVHDLEVRDDEDQQQFVQKVDEMEEHLDSYQSRIGGLEKAFQQVLPSLVDNVRDLTELVQEIKQERGIETQKNVSTGDIQDMDMEDWD